ncbi:hypothetical protein FOA52_006726 [Chlamydomonas sp. UWO 241]|nr:hypothetical protein FOA52_006726 [Chlamydomonas sp. UWO 241]
MRKGKRADVYNPRGRHSMADHPVWSSATRRATGEPHATHQVMHVHAGAGASNHSHSHDGHSHSNDGRSHSQDAAAHRSHVSHGSGAAAPPLPLFDAALTLKRKDTARGATERELAGSCPEVVPPSMVVAALQEAFTRGKWLLGLLFVQSLSSFVLDQYRDLLREHLVVTLFLTMLVGAGGNAGNQSAITVIRALATGSINVSWQSLRNCCLQQAAVALLLGGGMSLGGFLRVYLTNGGNGVSAAAISLSLFVIVMSSVVLGTALPFVLAKLGADPANAGTSIQVVMDILGVAITCFTCHIVLMQLTAGLVTKGGTPQVMLVTGPLSAADRDSF